MGIILVVINKYFMSTRLEFKEDIVLYPMRFSNIVLQHPTSRPVAAQMDEVWPT